MIRADAARGADDAIRPKHRCPITRATDGRHAAAAGGGFSMVLGRDGARRAERVLRAAVTAVFLAAAGMKLAAVPFEVEGFARFGYAPWFMVAIGAAQFVGAALLWIRGWTGLAALGLGAMMVGAVASHLRAGDPVAMAVPAMVLAVVLAGMAFARRREFTARLPRRFALEA